MEKNRSSKVVAIVALFIAVIGLSVGFAAFSNTLTIKSSATVKPSDKDFVVGFVEKTTDTALPTGDVELKQDAITVVGENASYLKDESLKPTLNGTTVSNLHANFTKPGESVSYKFAVANFGKYDAYLTNVTFANVAGQSAYKVCTVTPVTGEGQTAVTAALVTEACNGIDVSVKIDNATYNGADGSQANINTVLSRNTNNIKEVVVTISYAEGSEVADGAFSVDFGDITLGYSSVAQQ